MSELPAGISPAEPAAPRPSAAGIVLRRAASGWQALLALRSRRSRFMPAHLAFPGGALEPADRPDRPGAFARCVAREVGEETGLALPEQAWLAAGERTTPALFPQRFRTLFFVAELPPGAALAAAPPSPEIEALRFAEPAEVLVEWSAGRARVPPPVLPLLRALRAADADLVATAAALAAANAEEDAAPRIEFDPDVWMLPVRTATLPPASHTNVWMPGGERFAVIDPGSDDAAELERLLAVIARRRASGSQPKIVLLTHHHRDHTAGAEILALRLGVPLGAHPAVFERIGATRSGLERIDLDEGDRIDLGGMELVAHLTPGHAPGHLAFYLPERRALVAGDLASGVSTVLIDPDGGEMTAYLDSLERMQHVGARTLLPGHGPPLPVEALVRVAEHRRERERRVVAALGPAERSLGEIARDAYAGEDLLPAVLTERQTLAHLLDLERRGLARRAAAGTWMASRIRD
ncbi:MAG TPA: MBL fold metallo-hydrolase [Candidatus Polarisedimenticolaceae bacterium]|nr:MBL fold metallo-hydrolase [Candidatus Polarisedimenticolaceae bacterium]